MELIPDNSRVVTLQESSLIYEIPKNEVDEDLLSSDEEEKKEDTSSSDTSNEDTSDEEKKKKRRKRRKKKKKMEKKKKELEKKKKQEKEGMTLSHVVVSQPSDTQYPMKKFAVSVIRKRFDSHSTALEFFRMYSGQFTNVKTQSDFDNFCETCKHASWNKKARATPIWFEDMKDEDDLSHYISMQRLVHGHYVHIQFLDSQSIHKIHYLGLAGFNGKQSQKSLYKISKANLESHFSIKEGKHLSVNSDLNLMVLYLTVPFEELYKQSPDAFRSTFERYFKDKDDYANKLHQALRDKDSQLKKIISDLKARQSDDPHNPEIKRKIELREKQYSFKDDKSLAKDSALVSTLLIESPLKCFHLYELYLQYVKETEEKIEKDWEKLIQDWQDSEESLVDKSEKHWKTVIEEIGREEEGEESSATSSEDGKSIAPSTGTLTTRHSIFKDKLSTKHSKLKDIDLYNLSLLSLKRKLLLHIATVWKVKAVFREYELFGKSPSDDVQHAVERELQDAITFFEEKLETTLMPYIVRYKAQAYTLMGQIQLHWRSLYIYAQEHFEKAEGWWYMIGWESFKENLMNEKKEKSDLVQYVFSFIFSQFINQFKGNYHAILNILRSCSSSIQQVDDEIIFLVTFICRAVSDGIIQQHEVKKVIASVPVSRTDYSSQFILGRFDRIIELFSDNQNDQNKIRKHYKILTALIDAGTNDKSKSDQDVEAYISLELIQYLFSRIPCEKGEISEIHEKMLEIGIHKSIGHSMKEGPNSISESNQEFMNLRNILPYVEDSLNIFQRLQRYIPREDISWISYYMYKLETNVPQEKKIDQTIDVCFSHRMRLDHYFQRAVLGRQEKNPIIRITYQKKLGDTMQQYADAFFSNIECLEALLRIMAFSGYLRSLESIVEQEDKKYAVLEFQLLKNAIQAKLKYLTLLKSTDEDKGINATQANFLRDGHTMLHSLVRQLMEKHQDHKQTDRLKLYEELEISEAFDVLQQLSVLIDNDQSSGLLYAEEGRSVALVSSILDTNSSIQHNFESKMTTFDDTAKIKGLADTIDKTMIYYSLIQNDIFVWVIYPKLLTEKMTEQRKRYCEKTLSLDMGLNKKHEHLNDAELPIIHSVVLWNGMNHELVFTNTGRLLLLQMEGSQKVQVNWKDEGLIVKSDTVEEQEDRSMLILVLRNTKISFTLNLKKEDAQLWLRCFPTLLRHYEKPLEVKQVEFRRVRHRATLANIVLKMIDMTMDLFDSTQFVSEMDVRHEETAEEDDENSDDTDSETDSDDTDDEPEFDSAFTQFLHHISSKQITSTKQKQFNSLVEEVSKAILNPIKDLLPPTGSDIIVIPHDCLYFCPWNALVHPLSERFLVEEYNLTISYSLKMLNINRIQLEQGRKWREGKKQKTKKPRYLLGVQSGDDLECAKREISNIEDLITEKHAIAEGDVKLEKVITILRDATRKQVFGTLNREKKPSKPVIVHFSCHGAADREKKSSYDEYSAMGALCMREEEGKQNIYAHEVETWDLLGTELVVLSACQSALGKLTKMAGVRGLVRSVFCAQVPTVVASLWNIHDYFAMRIMKLFYEDLMSGFSSSQSLRNAINAMRQIDDGKFASHSVLWGAFCCYGEGSSSLYPLDRVVFKKGKGKVNSLSSINTAKDVSGNISSGDAPHGSASKKKKKKDKKSVGKKAKDKFGKLVGATSKKSDDQSERQSEEPDVYEGTTFTRPDYVDDE